MTIVYIAEYLDRYNKPLCDALAAKLGEGFRFIGTAELGDDTPDEQTRRRRGIVRTEAYMTDLRSGGSLIDAADAAIIDGAPDGIIVNRLKRGLPTLRCAERLLDGGGKSLLDPFTLYPTWLRHTRWRSSPFYLLCMSGRAEREARLTFSYPAKKLRWGVLTYPTDEGMLSLREDRSRSGDTVSILWAGALEEKKHPELALTAARFLRDSGVDFSMKLIGSGSMENELQFAIREGGLSMNVALLGEMLPDAVRINAEQADIFLYTAEDGEGWGRALSEAMSAGCAVISSSGAGAAEYMLRNGENGFVFDFDSTDELCEYTLSAAADAELRQCISRAAHDTMNGEWSAETAAERLIGLCRGIQLDDVPIFDSGVLSLLP